MELLYADEAILLCVKPPRVLSTDEPGGVPGLARLALGDPGACIRTVHRLDRVVSGLMVLARSPEAASELSRQIREREFEKEYLAVVHGIPASDGTLVDPLQRSKRERKTYVVQEPGKGVQEAVLEYHRLDTCQDLSLLSIHLQTGRTHQIRAQFSSRGFPLAGDRKYSRFEDCCEIALWSHRLSFRHPVTNEAMDFVLEPPRVYPWSIFARGE